jgi:LmbE family N-acetylglucosaminyl deacetylase
MKKNIGVIAAHPDDEVLGCGGTIAKHVANGDDVYVLILAEGLTSREVTRSREKHKDELAELTIAAQKANKILGSKQVTLLDFPDNRMDGVELLDVIKPIEKFIETYNCERIYSHHHSDVNIDHQVIHQAVLTACRSVPGQSVKELLCFEVQSSTEWQANIPGSFKPNWYEDISSFYKAKQKALEAYACEMRPWPHSRSYEALEHLAKWRGSNIGCNYAEAFELIRAIY